jgi:hypothetical protein
MFFATIVVVVALSPNNAASLPAIQQSAQQETTKPESSSAPQQNQTGPAAPAKPCAAGTKQASSGTTDCVPRKKKRTKKPTTEAPAATDGGPSKTVVHNGSTSEPTIDISPDVSPEQASKRTEATDQLMASANANLEKVSGRTLNSSQQDTVQQIQNYLRQARDAKTAGDLDRAYNLANKAKMLSVDLVGR